jgi:restriction system protein
MAKRRSRRRGGLSWTVPVVAVALVGWLVLRSSAPVVAWVVFGAAVLGLVALPVWKELDRRARRRTRRVRGAVREAPAARRPSVRVEAAPGARRSTGAVPRTPGQGGTTGPAAAGRMSGPEFERFVADLLRRDGCDGVEVSGGAGDRGADVTAISPEGHRVVVQCKSYHRGHPVGDPDLQRFLGTARLVHNAAIPLFVTTSRFTAPAVRLAREHGIVLVDGPALNAWTRGRTPLPPDPTEFVGEITG